jgi:hypothetical protein
MSQSGTPSPTLGQAVVGNASKWLPSFVLTVCPALDFNLLMRVYARVAEW